MYSLGSCCGYSLMSSECNETESSDSGIDDGYVIISSSFFKCDELCKLSFLVLLRVVQTFGM